MNYEILRRMPQDKRSLPDPALGTPLIHNQDIYNYRDFHEEKYFEIHRRCFRILHKNIFSANTGR
jgi:hypothetical protein